MTGRKWQRAGVQRYVHGKGVAAALPVTERTIGDPAVMQSGNVYLVSKEASVVRKTGFDQIDDWVEKGTPLPSGFKTL